jgi:membrane-bound inhibitor of C-type lysozyme
VRAALAAVVICAAFPVWTPAWADPLLVRNTTLVCDRNVEVPVVFVSGPEDGVAIVQIEGSQILLHQEPAASGARYAWPSGGSRHVILTKGDAAAILWREAGTESPLLTCALQI